MALDQALNGLRISSRAWLEYITSDTLGPLGLRACEREPCLFSGLVDGVECLVLVYVDDVLIACPDRKIARSSTRFCCFSEQSSHQVGW